MANYVVTWQSSTVIEASLMGTDSILLTRLPYDYGPSFATSEVPYSKYLSSRKLSYSTDYPSLAQLLN